MCCFSGKVHVTVSQTTIFARMVEHGRQALAYGMDLAVGEAVAMVLPLPIAPGSGDDAVKFVDLSATPKMFEELAQMFVMPSRGGPRLQGGAYQNSLEVHQVGSFVASYVPSRADFARLDRRFRISDALFDAVPHYSDYGFAVFQLAPGKLTIHPMAFTFPTRDARLFFPTVHVHDGRVHAKAKFDHSLYYQHPNATEPHGSFGGDQVSPRNVGKTYMDLALRDRPVVRRELHATLPNEDIWVA